ncbi:MAG: RluA family pseudouridine synthase [Actinomycetota bacterium]
MSEPSDWQPFDVPQGVGDRRLDAWLAEVSGVGRSEVQAMIEGGNVTVDGEPAAKSRRLRAGERVEARRTRTERLVDTSAPFSVAFEDEHLAVIVKPPGVVVHPAPGGVSGTLVEALATRRPLAPAAGVGRPGIVHRLDKDTSGLMVVAKTDEALAGVTAAMGLRQIARTYLALVAGSFAMATGRIEAPLGRSARDRTRMAVVAGGREAITEFTVLEALDGASFLEVHLGTGRTHQIRVHLAHIQHPVIGDAVYGRSSAALARTLQLHRPFLHSHRLQFVHPVTGVDVDLVEPLPADLQSALTLARSLGHGG